MRSRNRSSSRPRSSAASPAASGFRGCDVPTALARPLARLIDELSKLPGVGPKTAQRLAYYILRASMSDAEALASAVRSVKTDLRYCSTCFNIAETDPCAVCAADDRDHELVCVVEEPLDVLAIERTGQYKSVYHVLHGAISPVNGVRPDDLKIAQLVSRIKAGGVGELILATNPNLEGEATAMYIAQALGNDTVRVTRLARGLPMGGDLEYADEVTVSRALEGRRAISYHRGVNRAGSMWKWA